MRTSTVLGGLLAVTATTAAVLTGAGAASAAKSAYDYSGFAGGTQVNAVGSGITSDLTAEADLAGTTVPNASSNNIAAVTANGLLSTGAITSDVSAAAVGSDGTKLTAHVRTAGVNVLKGLVRADAVDSTAIAQNSSSGPDGGGTTLFTNLKVLGIKLPLTIPKNFTVTVPGIATITLNGASLTHDDTTVAGASYAIYVQLLTARGLAAAGSTFVVNPAYSVLTDPNAATQTSVGGAAYGSHLTAVAGTVLAVQAGRTAQSSVPPSGSAGATTTNSTASINLPGVLRSGTIQSSATSNITGSTAYSDTTAEIDGLNLFSGLIKADAVKVEARVDRSATPTYTPTMTMQLVNLKIAGQPISANVAPNTTINVAGLGKVVVNEQTEIGYAALIRGLHITVTTAQAGIPAGTDIEIAVASAWVFH